MEKSEAEELHLAENDKEDSHSEGQSNILEDIRVSQFAVGDIYWVKKFGKRVKIFSSGDYVNSEYLAKFIGRNLKIELEWFSNIQVINDGLELFTKLRDANEEPEFAERKKNDIRLEIMAWANSNYWQENTNSNFLDLVIACEKSFFELPTEVSVRLSETSLLLLKRSSAVASVSVMYAITCGYTDYNFLKDLYNICYLYYFGIENDSLTSSMLQALEKERVASSSGINFLKDFSDKKTMEMFINHPDRCLEKIKKLPLLNIENKSLLKLISFHQEKINGQGFPNGFNAFEMSDIELIAIIVNQSIEISEVPYVRGDGNSILKNILERVPDISFNRRIVKMVECVFETFNNQDEEYLEVSGL